MYVMIKRNKLSVIILNEIRGQVCACVKDVESVGERKPKYLYFVSSFRILGGVRVSYSWPQATRKGGEWCGTHRSVCCRKISARLISKDGVIPSPHSQLVPSLCSCTSPRCDSHAAASSPCRAGADGVLSCADRREPLCAGTWTIFTSGQRLFLLGNTDY